MRKRYLQLCFAVGLDEFRGKRRDDGIAVTAQSSHAGGYPMSQREKAGFSAPLFVVAAGDEFVSVPEHKATTFLLASVFPAGLYSSVPGFPAIGVGHPAILAALVSVSGLPRCAPVDSESSARGVGHPE
jgi:hypothetical protein